jgi:hypothetical protein
MSFRDWLLFMMLLAPSAGALFAETKPAQPKGLPLTTTISFGDDYMTPVELYDAKITVLEVVRGEKAREILKGGNPLNNPPGNFEYVAARIGSPSGRNTRGQAVSADVDQFTACSSDGAVEYPAVQRPFPNPALDQELGSGDSRKAGWDSLA